MNLLHIDLGPLVVSESDNLDPFNSKRARTMPKGIKSKIRLDCSNLVVVSCPLCQDK